MLLTHTGTCERVRLPLGHWELVFSEDGCDAVVTKAGDAEEDDRVLDVSTLLTKTLLQSATGAQIMQIRDAAGQTTTIDWDMERSRHRPAYCSLALLPVNVTVRMTTYVFIRPRSLNQRAFWCLSRLYELLNLKSYGGSASRWFFNSKVSWSKAFVSIFGYDQLVEGTYMNDGANKKQTLPWPERCLGHPSVSTAGLLALTCRWCVLRREAGGLSTDGPRSAAKHIFMNCARIFGYSGATEVRLICGMDWHWEWPRPLPAVDGRTSVALGVTGDAIDLTALASAAGRPDRVATAHNWWKILSKALGILHLDICKVPIATLAEVCAGDMKLRSMFGQLLAQVFVAIERFLGSMAKFPAKRKECDINFVWMDASDDLTANQRDLTLAQYTECCYHATIGHNMFSCCTDKANVRAVPLQVTAIGLTNGVVMLPPPAVALVQRGVGPTLSSGVRVPPKSVRRRCSDS